MAKKIKAQRKKWREKEENREKDEENEGMRRGKKRCDIRGGKGERR